MNPRLVKKAISPSNSIYSSGQIPVPDEFLIMPLLKSETIPDNVTATQNALDLPEMVGAAQLFLPTFVDSSSDESESYCNTPGTHLTSTSKSDSFQNNK